MSCYTKGLLAIPLFMLAACNSGETGSYNIDTSRNRHCSYIYNCSPFPFGLNKTEHMSAEQKKEYFRQKHAQRLQEKGRVDNSTDGGARFGW